MRVASIDHNKPQHTTSLISDRWAKKLILKWLVHFSRGSLLIEDGDERYQFGQKPQQAEIVAHIKVNHESAYRDVLFNGTVGSGEAYMKGTWESPNLTNVIRLMCLNMEMLNKINRGWSKLNSVMATWMHRLRTNNKKNARRNIAAHYDLGNEFFSLFLDSSMMYSSAIYPSQQATLEDAARYKLAHICKRLQLTETDHLLEIGTGWGGMAIHAAKHHGCRVTTTTISKEQFKHTVAAVKAAQLEHRVTVLLDDYRDLRGQFDKLVSIEMIEAVGRSHYPDYFATCSRLLKPQGLMLIQAITMPDQRYGADNSNSDFIQRYIFPGGDLPSVGAISQHVGCHTDMQIAGIEDITADYARTLADWRQRFFAKLAAVRSLGYDDVFIRMWDFYLSYCEGGFMQRSINTLQMLIAKPGCSQFPSVAG